MSVVYAWKEKGEGKVKAVCLDLTLRQSVSFPFPFCNWFMKSTLSRKLSYVLFLRRFIREKYMSSLKVNLYSRRKKKWWWLFGENNHTHFVNRFLFTLFSKKMEILSFTIAFLWSTFLSKSIAKTIQLSSYYSHG